MKTRIILLVSILVTQISIAQMGGRGMRGGGMRGGGMQGGRGQAAMPKFKAENMAGFITYDEAEIIKKLKIKKPVTQQKVKALIRAHNQKMLDLKLRHHKKLTEVDNYIQRKRQEAMLQKDFALMQQTKAEAREALAPVRQQTAGLEKELNAGMQKILSKKQQKKWHKYQKKQRKKLMPQRNQPAGASGHSGRQGRGMRGGGMRGGGF